MNSIQKLYTDISRWLEIRNEPLVRDSDEFNQRTSLQESIVARVSSLFLATLSATSLVLSLLVGNMAFFGVICYFSAVWLVLGHDLWIVGEHLAGPEDHEQNPGARSILHRTILGEPLFPIFRDYRLL
ncbi:MAG: hypothetical protein AAGF04_00640 [Chlamydiota bacterium]